MFVPPMMVAQLLTMLGQLSDSDLARMMRAHYDAADGPTRDALHRVAWIASETIVNGRDL